jgi:hypothetical protein
MIGRVPTTTLSRTDARTRRAPMAKVRPVLRECQSSMQGDAMLVCPFDMHWCDRAGCATACELSGEKPLLHCDSCGILIVRPVAHGLCVDCIAIHVVEQEKG